jgi:hypothetical protein
MAEARADANRVIEIFQLIYDVWRYALTLCGDVANQNV